MRNTLRGRPYLRVEAREVAMRGEVLAVLISSLVSVSAESAAASSAASVSGAGRDAAPPASRPAIRWEPFPIVSPWGAPSLRADLGRIRVLENRAAHGGREIELAFVRIPSTARHPGSPIVWLAGGPGGSGIDDLETPALRVFLELRSYGDVIALDQRGTGLSVPRLDCPGTIQFPRDVPLDRTRSLDGLEAAARACSEHWRAAGVDLAAYNTRESAEDLEDLRVALGVPKLRLLGGSYGTHLALAAIRAHEDRIERAVLVGVVGPDHLRRSPGASEKQLAEIARLASRDPSIAGRVPDLIALIREVRDRLDRTPVAVPVDLPGGGTISVVVGKFDLEWYTRSLLFSRETIARLPAVFAAMAAGDFSELARTTAFWRMTPAPSASMFAMRCASGASAERLSRIESEKRGLTLGETMDFAEDRICRAWGVPPLPDDFRAPVQSSVPALFVSGSLDGDTPGANADEVARGFPNGGELVVEGAPHALLAVESAPARLAIARFLGEGRLPRERVALPPLDFEKPRAARSGEPLLAGRRESPAIFWGGGMP